MSSDASGRRDLLNRAAASGTGTSGALVDTDSRAEKIPAFAGMTVRERHPRAGGDLIGFTRYFLCEGVNFPETLWYSTRPRGPIRTFRTGPQV